MLPSIIFALALLFSLWTIQAWITHIAGSIMGKRSPTISEMSFSAILDTIAVVLWGIFYYLIH